MKDKKKKNRLWSAEFKLKVVLDIIENELSYSQAERKYDMYL
jgi:transposase